MPVRGSCGSEVTGYVRSGCSGALSDISGAGGTGRVDGVAPSAPQVVRQEVEGMGEATGRPDRREDLLAAAGRRFIAVGIRKTTMEDIAREARAGKATLYRHFGNKDEVIDALLEREGERFTRALQRGTSGQDTAAGQLEGAFLAGVRFFVEHPILTKGRDEEPGILLPRITSGGGPLVQRGLALFTDLIGEGVAAGQFREVDPDAAAEVVVRLILSYFAFPPMHVRVEDPEEAAAFARGLVAGALRA